MPDAMRKCVYAEPPRITHRAWPRKYVLSGSPTPDADVIDCRNDLRGLTTAEESPFTATDIVERSAQTTQVRKASASLEHQCANVSRHRIFYA